MQRKREDIKLSILTSNKWVIGIDEAIARLNMYELDPSVDADGNTPLHHLMSGKYNDMEKFRLLNQLMKQYQIDINAKNNEGLTAFDLAIMHISFRTAAELSIRYDAKIDLGFPPSDINFLGTPTSNPFYYSFINLPLFIETAISRFMDAESSTNGKTLTEICDAIRDGHLLLGVLYSNEELPIYNREHAIKKLQFCGKYLPALEVLAIIYERELSLPEVPEVNFFGIGTSYRRKIVLKSLYDIAMIFTNASDIDFYNPDKAFELLQACDDYFPALEEILPMYIAASFDNAGNIINPHAYARAAEIAANIIQINPRNQEAKTFLKREMLFPKSIKLHEKFIKNISQPLKSSTFFTDFDLAKKMRLAALFEDKKYDPNKQHEFDLCWALSTYRVLK